MKYKNFSTSWYCHYTLYGIYNIFHVCYKLHTVMSFAYIIYKEIIMRETSTVLQILNSF